mgnify:CR=1 FL=1
MGLVRPSDLRVGGSWASDPLESLVLSCATAPAALFMLPCGGVQGRVHMGCLGSVRVAYGSRRRPRSIAGLHACAPGHGKQAGCRVCFAACPSACPALLPPQPSPRSPLAFAPRRPVVQLRFRRSACAACLRASSPARPGAASWRTWRPCAREPCWARVVVVCVFTGRRGAGGLGYD